MPTTFDLCKSMTVVDRRDWRTLECEVTAAQTFVLGDWVQKDSAGTLAIAATSGNDVDSSAVQLFGIAQASAVDMLAQPAGRRLCPVLVPNPGAVFIAQIYHATLASAVLAQTDVDGAATPQILPLRNQGGNWCLSLAGDGTDDVVAVMGRHPKYAWSTTYGWFYCTIIPAGLYSTPT